jgi:alpha-D-ribose 1-methylphosphonate 5-triphosphate synthase subunit PhnG
MAGFRISDLAALTSGTIASGDMFLVQDATETGDIRSKKITYGELTTGIHTSYTIPDGSVTYAKLQDISAQYRLLGRSSAGAGDAQEITSSANAFSLIGAADYAAMRTLLDLEPGVDFVAISGGTFTGTVNVSQGAAATTASGTFVNTTDNASVQALRIEGDRATPSTNDTVYAGMYLSNASGTQFEFARIEAVGTTLTASSEAGRIRFYTASSGTLVSRLQIGSTTFFPSTNDGVALGQGANAFSDLFLASGGVINFNNGDVTVTHSTNALAFAGASSGYSFDAGVSISLSDDTASAGPLVIVERVSASAANNDIMGRLVFRGRDDAGNAADYAYISSVIIDPVNGSEDGAIVFNTLVNNVATDHLTLRGGNARFNVAAVPNANDGSALGTAALGWSDLHLATGGVINWVNGDVTITHSSNALAFAGASSGYSFDATVSVSQGAAATTPSGTFVNTTDNASVQALRIEGDRATPAANDEVYASFLLSDSAGNQSEFARITALGATITNNSEVGQLRFGVANVGAVANLMLMNTTRLGPLTNDGLALGVGSAAWADLFLASGGVVNFNNGDVTITHSSNALSGAGGQLYWQYEAAATTAPLWLANKFDAASVTALRIEGDRATPTNNDAVDIDVRLSSSTGTQTSVGRLKWVNFNVTASSENTFLYFGLNRNGTMTDYLALSSEDLAPVANDGISIGAATRSFSDLYLASGGVINFNNGDVTLTHSADALTVAGGDVILADVGPSSTLSAGFRGSPVNTQNTAYTLVLTDAGKTIYHDEVTARTYTIPANSSVTYPIGTTIIIDNTGNSGSAGTITLSITTDTLRRGDGTAGTGSRTIAASAVAVIRKTKSTEWVITGTYT